MIDRQTIAFIKEHEKDDIRTLALQSKRYPEMDMPFVLQQIAGRKMASEKIPSWHKNESIAYPKQLSLEQCSSEKTALYKASLCEKGGTLVDLTGGMGVDFSFMSQQYQKAVYVEKEAELVVLAKHNFEALGLKNSEVMADDAPSYLDAMDAVDTIYIDPARRNGKGEKTVLIEDCTPSIIELEDALTNKSKQLIIKLSPMLDISLALKSLKCINEVHIISLNNECKELLFVKNKSMQKNTLHCINILKDSINRYSFTTEDEEQARPSYAKGLKKYLYEANTSILKAGAYKSIAKSFELEKLHQNSHLYTSDKLHDDFPGRIFVIENSLKFNKKETASHLQNIAKANITVRNFPLSVEEIRKKTGIKDGGEWYIFATTLLDDTKILILCKKAN